MSTHTPGPWHRCAASKDECRCGIVWGPTGNVHVATATYVGNAAADDLEAQELYVNSLAEAVANARLIAAAPDLLEALQLFVEREEPGALFSEWMQKGLAAIAKATVGKGEAT